MELTFLIVILGSLTLSAVQGVSASASPAPSLVSCKVSGCSSQICSAETGNIFSTCEFIPYYECFSGRKSLCQVNGTKCNWVPDVAMRNCLVEKKAPASAMASLGLNVTRNKPLKKSVVYKTHPVVVNGTLNGTADVNGTLVNGTNATTTTSISLPLPTGLAQKSLAIQASLSAGIGLTLLLGFIMI